MLCLHFGKAVVYKLPILQITEQVIFVHLQTPGLNELQHPEKQLEQTLLAVNHYHSPVSRTVLADEVVHNLL